jgi:hypothetical protein
MATPIPLWKKSIDDAIASGKSTDAMRAKLSNNPANSVVLKNALEYLNSKSAVPKLSDATTGPYTKQNADAAMNTQASQPSQPYQAPQPTQSNSWVAPVSNGNYSLWEFASTNSWVDKLNTTMDAYADNAKKTAADTEANARKTGQEASNITAQRDAEKLIRTANQEAELRDIQNTRESNIDLRRKDANDLLNKQDQIAAMNSNIAMADAGKSGLQLSQGDLTTIQNDIMNKYASNIANAMDFKNKTNMTLDEALTNTGLAIFSKQSEIDTFKNAIQDAKYAPILDAVNKAAAGNQKAIDDVNTFYQTMTQKKVDSEFTGTNIEEIIATKERSFQEASAQKKENLIAEDLKDVPWANYIISQIATIINKYPGRSRTFIMWELANMAMAKSDAQAQMIQSIAQGTKISQEIKNAADRQTAGSLNMWTESSTGKLAQEIQLETANPAKQNNTAPITTKAPYQLSAANQTFINNALRNSTPAKLDNMVKILDTQLKNWAIWQDQYNAVKKAIWR